jgi:ADP-ribose pyrophosphatase
MHLMNERVAFSTPWFEIIAKQLGDDEAPHYALRTKDYVSVVTVTQQGQLLLVRQFRPAAGHMTLELPSGHVEEGETPELAARRELLEETGHVADSFEFLGNLSPDTGRLANRMWCFFAADARPADLTSFRPEPGIEPVFFEGTLSKLIAEREFDSALNCAALFHAILRGHLATE